MSAVPTWKILTAVGLALIGGLFQSKFSTPKAQAGNCVVCQPMGGGNWACIGASSGWQACRTPGAGFCSVFGGSCS
jgi:hypothetical protein